MTGVADSVVAAARNANALSVESVTLRVGQMTEAIEDALHFAFDVLKEGEPLLAHAELKVIMVPPRSRCLECGAEYQHAETAIDCLRDIENVEIAAMLKEKEPGTVKCSLRAKSTGNVVDIASFFGGGGHVKAAGYTFRGTMDDARRTLKEQLERSRDTLQGR